MRASEASGVPGLRMKSAESASTLFQTRSSLAALHGGLAAASRRHPFVLTGRRR
jgi:hypothetical protein